MVTFIQLTARQLKIIEIVKNQGPITGEQIASLLDLTRATLRPDLAILTMSGILDARPRVGYYYSGKSPQSFIAETMRQVLVRISSRTGGGKRQLQYDSIVTMFTEDVGTLFVVGDGGVLVEWPPERISCEAPWEKRICTRCL